MSERNRAREYPPVSAIDDLPSGVHQDIEVFPENRVREPSSVVSPAPVLNHVPFSPAHPLNRLKAQLNENWRVVDDPLQWVLQRRKGNPRKKTRVGKSDLSARRERGCCDVFVSLVARPMTKPSPSYTRSPIFILTGSRLDEHCKTSTFTGRLRTSE
jgi:hypothetical protein